MSDQELKIVTIGSNRITPDLLEETTPFVTPVPSVNMHALPGQNKITPDPEGQDDQMSSPPIKNAPPFSVQVFQGQDQSQNQNQGQYQAQTQALAGVQQEQAASKSVDSAEGWKDVFQALVKTFFTELVLTLTVPSRLLTLGKALSFLGLAYILFCAIPVVVTTVVKLIPEITKEDVLGIVKEVKEKDLKNMIKAPEKEIK